LRFFNYKRERERERERAEGLGEDEEAREAHGVKGGGGGDGVVSSLAMISAESRRSMTTYTPLYSKVRITLLVGET
jgi:hypothetical protein